jgi:hypothetical protein
VPLASIAPVNVNGVAADYFTFAFHRSPSARGVKFLLETSADLLTWTPVNSSLILVGSQPNLDGTLTDTYRSVRPVLDSTSPSFFLKLRVEPE